MPKTGSDLEVFNRLLQVLAETHGERAVNGPSLNKINRLLAEIETVYCDLPELPPPVLNLE